ncbi:response regulator [Clostridium sp. UBA4548]|uniref:response regulator n=1 Tax=Clostridium sp. UBA4548 TaxID=1946361 RepID=UPI0025C0A032|nr:response regulator transcription factor [Clostridium sp. UBA4548]
MDKKVLIVDDEKYILELLQVNLESNGFEVITCDKGNEVIGICEEAMPDVILLDLMLPGLDGLEICKKVRNHPKLFNTVIIMITARGDEIDKVVGLELGADDYMSKPFSVREVIARIKAIFRRIDAKGSNTSLNICTKNDSLRIDYETGEVFVADEKVNLSYMEFKLLEVLAHNRGNIVQRQELFRQVWGYELIEETRTLDVHIRKLRKKLGDDEKYPNLIETVRGLGYKLK